MFDRPPRRRLRLQLDLGADDMLDLVDALAEIGRKLEIGADEREITSGGHSSGYHLTLTCDPDMDSETYREQLQAWSKAQREGT